MKNTSQQIPQYTLQNFRHIHRHEHVTAAFGYNNLDVLKRVAGFEMYSSEGLIGSVGPFKSAFYRISITVTGTLDMQIGLDKYKHQPQYMTGKVIGCDGGLA
jgi:AraC family transcriptional regulator, transcriptional activator of pobA